MHEEWRACSIEGYKISSFGRLMKPSGEIQIGSINAQGYRQFMIQKGKFMKVIHAHKEVCIAWHGPKPFLGAQARHKDDDKNNCASSNMYWGTHQDNMDDRTRNGKTASGERVGLAKLTWDQVREIRSLQNVISRTAIIARFGISRPTLQSILSNKTWRE